MSSAAWHSLSASEMRTYLAIALHADANGRCWPAIDRIAELSGAHVKTVGKAISKLKQCGLLQVEKNGGGRSKSNRYRLLNPREPAEVSSSNPPPSDGGLSNKTSADWSPNPRQMVPQTSAKRRGEQTREQTNKQQAAPVGDDALVQALTAAGVGEPARSKLAQLDLTPEIVRSVQTTCRARGKETGAIIRELQARAEQRHAQADQTSRRDRVIADKQQKARNEAETLRREQEDRKQWYRALSDSEREVLRRDAEAWLETHPLGPEPNGQDAGRRRWAAVLMQKLRDANNHDRSVQEACREAWERRRSATRTLEARP